MRLSLCFMHPLPLALTGGRAASRPDLRPVRAADPLPLPVGRGSAHAERKRSRAHLIDGHRVAAAQKAVGQCARPSARTRPRSCCASQSSGLPLGAEVQKGGMREAGAEEQGNAQHAQHAQSSICTLSQAEAATLALGFWGCSHPYRVCMRVEVHPTPISVAAQCLDAPREQREKSGAENLHPR